MQRLYLVHSANEKFCEKKDMAITVTIITIAITTMIIITSTCIGEKEIRQGMTRNEELVRGEKGVLVKKKKLSSKKQRRVKGGNSLKGEEDSRRQASARIYSLSLSLSLRKCC